MLRRYIPLFALVLAALACNAVGGGNNGTPTEPVQNVATAAAETATALVASPVPPTVEGAPSATPEGAASATAAPADTAAPATAEPATVVPAATCVITYADFVFDLNNPTNIG